jgi:TrmH family RNA methyltransferase
MNTISSKDNQIVKEAASLKEKKYRDALGLYLIEGPNLVRELMDFGGRPRFIFLKAGAGEEAQAIARKAEKLTAVYELSAEAFAKVSSDSSPQGIIAAAEKDFLKSDEFFRRAGDGNVLVLDRLQDPGNVGTLLRSAEAFGFAGAVLVKGCADPYQTKCVRAAAGSILRFPMLFCDSGKEAAKVLRGAGKKLYAACMEGEVSLYDAALERNTAVIIGNEGNGVSEELISEAERLYIPMYGATESLNAAIAGTIIMYEAKRQNKQ